MRSPSKRHARAVNILAVVLCTVAAIGNISVRQYVVLVFLVPLIVINAGCIVVNTKGIRREGKPPRGIDRRAAVIRERVLRRIASRPLPPGATPFCLRKGDPCAIARMEQAGAPHPNFVPNRPKGSTPPDRPYLKRPTTCECAICRSVSPVAHRGLCKDCR